MFLKQYFSYLLLPAGIFLMLFAGCASHPVRFSDSIPLVQENDTLPVPLPRETKYEEFNDVFNTILRRPIVDALEFSRPKPSADVNALDEVTPSSWFRPRLGYRKITPEELLRGPLKYGPPQPPLKVTRGKFAGLTPGFIAEDSRGISYVFKFDPKNFPGIETTAALIVNRLFWGFGYNVPEDYFYYLSEEDLFLDPAGELTQANLDSILSRVSPPEYGWYRCTVSKFIEGALLGPFPATGVREDDPNDVIPHERRRTLRALRVFGAFTNYTDLRLENTLDVYFGKAGQGYVRHYLLDFGGALGAFSAEKDHLWEGSNYLFSFREVSENLFTMGLRVQAWENLRFTPWKSVGAFESKIFNPAKWRETYPFAPVQQSQPADNYWAAKILGSLSREHIEMLVMAANYPEDEAAAYVLKTLMERRRKTIEYFLTQVSPLEVEKFSDGKLYLIDMAKMLLGEDYFDSRYKIDYFNDSGNRVGKELILTDTGTRFSLEVPADLIEHAGGYLKIDILTEWKYRSAPTPAQFHFRLGENGEIRLAGVIH